MAFLTIDNRYVFKQTRTINLDLHNSPRIKATKSN